MVVVTGGARFLGANIVISLNDQGIGDILVVDNLPEKGDKFRNLTDCEIADYLDKRDFIARVERGDFSPCREFKAIFTKAPAPTPWSTTAST